ncbi:hypothetical protein CR513_15999, partial [Mucuna pruriens]
MGLINRIKIQKFYIHIKIIVNDFFLDTLALFDRGADSNCILEGLIPTKYFEKTLEKLCPTKTNFLLDKNLNNEVILRIQFIKALFPLQISKKR